MPNVNEVRTVIEKGNLDQVEALLTKFPDLAHQILNDPEPTSALLIAISTGDLKKIELLLDRGADIHQQPVNVAEWYLQQLGRYADVDAAILRLFVKRDVTFTEAYRLSEATFNNVYGYGKITVFKLLLKLGFDPVEDEKQRKTINPRFSQYAIEMALHNLSWNQSTRIASHLLELGCSTETTGDYYTIIDRALQKGAYSFIGELLDAKVKPEFSGNIVKELLGEHRDMPLELLQRLIVKDTDFMKVDGDGDTFLHLAIYEENDDILAYLISKGVDINAQNKSGKTALHIGVTSNFKAGIKALIKLGADLNLMDDKGKTPLDLSLRATGFKQMCGQMAKAGGKTSLELSGQSFDENDSSQVLLLIKQSVETGEVWAETFLEKLAALPIDELTVWNQFIRHCLENNASKPSRKWAKEANSLIEALGVDVYREYMSLLLPLIKEKRSKVIEYDHEIDNYREAERVDYITESNTRILKGMLWTCSRFNEPAFSSMVRKLAGEMYKKIFNVGMRNAKLGNAALYCLSQMQGTAGIKEVVILRASTKYNPALVNINRVFDSLAKDLDMTPDELAAMSIPDYGLSDVGYYELVIGGYTAEVTLTAVGKTELLWSSGEKSQKTLPIALKKDHADTVKTLKETIKELQVASRAHSLRIEQQYLKQTLIEMSAWKENYVDHKLIGSLARRLIWRLSFNKQHVDVIYSQAMSCYVDAENNKVALPDEASVILWHPSMSSANEVLVWRDWFIEQEVTQPFKQAHREIYLLTDAERTTENHSLRFANHILSHGQFNALATQRGWSQTKGGGWDGGSENSAYKTVQGLDIEFAAEGLDQHGLTGYGIYSCVATSTVTFRKRHKRINLDKIDPLLFSEVMRDVDLFVGVSSVGNDPDWADRDTNRYWQDHGFGDLSATAKTRFDVLSVLIPKLKIAPQLTLEGRFLKVAGKLCTYKIHLGSANILMEPNDSYLCIVGTRERNLVMLPFEGDRTLSMILSKAMLLANDDKIKDQTILSQINGLEAV